MLDLRGVFPRAAHPFTAEELIVFLERLTFRDSETEDAKTKREKCAAVIGLVKGAADLEKYKELAKRSYALLNGSEAPEAKELAADLDSLLFAEEREAERQRKEDLLTDALSGADLGFEPDELGLLPETLRKKLAELQELTKAELEKVKVKQ